MRRTRHKSQETVAYTGRAHLEIVRASTQLEAIPKHFVKNLEAGNATLKNTTVSKVKTDDNIIQCETCKEKFENADQLDKHKTSCTSQICQCDMCGEYLMRMDDLKEHVRSVHPGEARTEKEDKKEDDDSQN